MEHVLPLEIVKEFVESEALERLSTGALEQEADGFLVPHVAECTMAVIIVQNKSSKTAREETIELARKPAERNETFAGSGVNFVLRLRWRRSPKRPNRRFSKVSNSLGSQWSVVALAGARV